MLVKEMIALVNEVRPNAIPDVLKLRWINEIEGKLASQVFLVRDVESYLHESDEEELVLEAPWDGVYEFYLYAMIHNANAEYDRYDNSYAIYNEKLSQYKKWYTTHYPTVGDVTFETTKVVE